MHKFLIGGFFAAAACLIFFISSMPDGALHVYFLDVGQGDAIFVRTPSGKNILIDGGPERKVLPQLKNVLPFFDNSFDLIILTHPDRDHLEGLIYVAKKYKVKKILFSGTYDKNILFKQFLSILADKNIPVAVADFASDFDFGDGVKIDVLFPFQQMIGADQTINNAMVISKIRFGSRSVLLTGDSDIKEEEKLAQNYADIASDVLKVSHHGSKTGTSKKILKSVAPKYCVISVGKGNTYGHPHNTVLQDLKNSCSQIFRTDKNGTIEFIFASNSEPQIKFNPNA